MHKKEPKTKFAKQYAASKIYGRLIPQRINEYEKACFTDLTWTTNMDKNKIDYDWLSLTYDSFKVKCNFFNGVFLVETVRELG